MHRMVPGLVLASVLGCGSSDAPTTPPPPAVTRDPIAAEAESSHVAPSALSADEAGVVARAVNGLGAAMFARLASEPGNVVLSPVGIEASLAMAALGARGPTRAEMLRVLHSDEQTIDVFARALQGWTDRSPDTHTLRVATSLFGDDRHGFEEPYVARARTSFAARVEPLDLLGAAEPSRLHINAWVAEQTGDRIRDLVPSNAIASDARLVLASAATLDARWEAPFDRAQTRPDWFLVDDCDAGRHPAPHRRRGACAHRRRDGDRAALPRR